MARYALVVGIAEYKDASLKNLSKPEGDAEAVAQLLRDHGQCERVTVLKGHVTAEDLEEALTTLVTEQAARHEAIIYFTGHGLAVKGLGGTKGYLATSDCKLTMEGKQPKRQTKAIALSEINDLICSSDLSSLVMFIDACNSGELIERELVERSFASLESEQDYYLITACRGHEKAWAKKREDHSVFTGAVLDALAQGNANNDGEITGDRLFDLLRSGLKGSRQEPMRFGKGRAVPIVRFHPRQQISPQENVVETAPKPKTKRRNWGIPLQMPPLPEHFVERPKHQNKVKEQLLSESQKTGTLVVSAIYGLGGIGKSVLASKLAHDDDVQTRFADGILWSTLGQNPDILPLLSGWIQALGDHDYKPTAVEAASNHLRTLLYDKHALLVVDDVWNPAHLEPFRVGGDKCCVLVTTRQAKIPEAHRYSLDVMSPEQALELMTQKLKEELSEQDTQQALDFAERVGYLPLALELAASQIEEGVTWPELFEDFQDEVVRLEALDLYGREDIPDDAKRRKYSLTACFNLSLKQLSAEQLRQFAWLGIVPEDVSLTQEMAVTLWQVSKRQAGSILRTFSSKALLLQGAKQAGPEGRRTFRMHDLMHDLAQRLLVSAPQPAQEGDLPGLGMTKAEAHSEFLERYRGKTERGQWHTLRDDGYIYDRLTWHMEQAKQVQEIHGLLRASNADGRNGWYEACDAIGKPAGFVNDVARAWELAKENYANEPGETLVLLFRYALMRTSINSMASNIPAELVGALVEKKVWSPAQGLAYAQQVQNPWHRTKCIAVIIPHASEPLLLEVQKTVEQIRQDSHRAYLLDKLAKRLPSVWPDVLKVVSQIQDQPMLEIDGKRFFQGFCSRAYALGQIAKHLPSEHLKNSVEIFSQIPSKPEKLWRALYEFAQQLPSHLLIDFLQATPKFTDNYSTNEKNLVETLLAISEDLLPNSLPEVLSILHPIKDKSSRKKILSFLVKKLSAEDLSVVYSSLRAGQDGYQQLLDFIELISKLPELLPETLLLAQKIENKEQRFRAFFELSKQKPKLLPETLSLAQKIENKEQRFRALVELSRQIPELLPELVNVTSQISNESKRVDALTELAEFLPLELLSEVIKIIQQIDNEAECARSLRRTCKYMSSEQLAKAMEIVQGMDKGENRVDVLTGLAEYLPFELWTKAIQITRQIDNPERYISALIGLSKHLSQDLWPEIIEITHQINNESHRARFLSNAMRYIPPKFFPELLDDLQRMNDEKNQVDILSNFVKYAFPEHIKHLTSVLGIVSKIEEKNNRLKILRTLVAYLPTESLTELLELTRYIQDQPEQVETFSRLAKNIPKLAEKPLNIIRQIRDEPTKAEALCNLVKNLPELSSELLPIVCQIKNESERTKTLNMLVEFLSPDLASNALLVIHEISNEKKRADALIQIVKYLPSKQLPDAFNMLSQFQNQFELLRVLCGSAEYLTPDLLDNTFELINEIRDIGDCFNILLNLVSHLPKELLSKVIKVAYQLEDENQRIAILSECATREPKLIPEVLNLIQKMDDKEKVDNELESFACQLGASFPTEALSITQLITSDPEYLEGIFYEIFYDMSGNLINPNLSLEDWTTALDITTQIEAQQKQSIMASIPLHKIPTSLAHRALSIVREAENQNLQHINDSLDYFGGLVRRNQIISCLAKLTNSFPELWPEILEPSFKDENEFEKAERLCRIFNSAESIPLEICPTALQLVGQIKFEREKSAVVKRLLRYLPTRYLSRIKEIILSMEDKYFSAKAFGTDLPSLTRLPILFLEWSELLAILSYQNRKDLLSQLSDIKPIIRQLNDDEQTFLDILQAVQDVCAQWP
ncbi:MAG: NB-ARC domain-containing protein [Cyanobacteria bacterium P01_C01_bin.118]